MQRLAEGEKALARQDTYALFQVIQDLAPRRSRERVQIRDIQGHVLIPEAEALELVRYWSDVFCQGSDARPPRRLQQALHLTPADIHSALRRLKGRKAVAPGNALSAVWKALAEPLSNYLADYFHAHWTPGVVAAPTAWTDSTLHFLTKPNKPAKRAQDLRPIALQSAGAKAVLLAIKDRLMPFFLEAMVRLPQYAYVAGRGTTEAILRVTLHCARIREVIQTQKMTIHDRFAGARRAGCTGGIQMSLDLSKAFDTWTPGSQANLRPAIFSRGTSYSHDKFRRPGNSGGKRTQKKHKQCANIHDAINKSWGKLRKTTMHHHTVWAHRARAS